jgi:hypothetical protein
LKNPNRERGTLVLDRRPPAAGASAKTPKSKPQPKAPKVAKPKGPAWMPPEWTPGRTAAELRAQLPELVSELHPVFSLGVAPLALGAGPALVEVARPGCRQRVRRWLRAYVNSDAYLQALAAEGARRHDRRGVPVEPVDPEHQAEARRRLRLRGRGLHAAHPDPRQQRTGAMDSPGKPEAGGVELASERFPDLGKVLVVGLVRLPDGHAVELGLWTIAAERLVEPPMPLVFMAEGTPRVRRLVDKAIEVLPRAKFDEDGVVVLAQEPDAEGEAGEMGCTAMRSPDGAGLFSLWWTDASGVASVPLDKAGALARVLRAAERQLAEWGVVPLAGDLRN